RCGPAIATRTRNRTTMPPPIATLSRRNRIHAICPRDRPWMSLPGTDNAASGAPPPGPVPTSMGTAIVTPYLLLGLTAPPRTTRSSVPSRHGHGRLSRYVVRLRHFVHGCQTCPALVA